jgi:hypothetical protein
MNSTNYLQFIDLVGGDSFDVMSNVRRFRVEFSDGLIVDERMLDRHVFGNLREMNFENFRLGEIRERAFVNTQSLTRIFLQLVNVEQFFQRYICL